MFADRLLDGDITNHSKAQLAYFMNLRLAPLPPNPPQELLLPHVRDLVSLIIRLPESQLH